MCRGLLDIMLRTLQCILACPRFLVCRCNRVGALSNSRKCFNLTMTAMQYKYLLDSIQCEVKDSPIDYYLPIASNALMMVFWIFDLIALLSRNKILKIPHSKLLRLQLTVNLFVLTINLITKVRRYLRLKRELAGDKCKEREKQMREKTKILFAILKIFCDLPGTLEITRILKNTIGYSFHDVTISTLNIGSALISLRNSLID
eukprot:TRINITY_DN5448_c0_g3_i2.p1 TRINITY_DN5448_c0_g3~~TRINITY_DN5448_c0_g3_i2.p1  ORF type:complete len:203 (-),score=23.80 TRINITY_DN5448_c0_g3_i2:12-620(-)